MSQTKKVLFLCGSPRGKKSASRITSEYMARFLDADCEWIDVGRSHLSANPEEADPKFLEIVEKMNEADAIVWVFGAWIWFMQLDLQHLLDKLFTQDVARLEGKLAAAILTSVRVRDDYILEKTRFISEQLGMHYLGDVSADGNPMTGYDGDEKMTERCCRTLAQQIGRALEDGYRPMKAYPLFDRNTLSSAWSGEPLSVNLPFASKTGAKKIAILVGESTEKHPALQAVVDIVLATTRNRVEVIELNKLKVGRCIGCYECDFRVEGKCIVKDDYEQVKQKVLESDAVVMVGVASCSVVDAKLKAFLDRSWGIAHRPPLQQKHGLALIVGAGALGRETAIYLQQLQSMMNRYCIAAIAADDNNAIETIRRAVQDLDQAMDEGWNVQKRFTEKAISAEFRDLAATAGMVLKADFKYRKDNNLFNAPSPGGKNAVFRLLFKNGKLADRLIAAETAQTLAKRKARLDEHFKMGSRQGASKASG